MKLFRKFALLAVVSSVLGSAFVLGCGGGEETTTETTNTDAAGNTGTSTTTTETD
jgi:hypothetical protein